MNLALETQLLVKVVTMKNMRTLLKILVQK